MSMTPQNLHPQLRDDTHWLGTLDDSAVLLHRNAALPWLILVPCTQVIDLLDLPPHQRDALLGQCAALSQFLKLELGYPRVNFAGLGNQVPQLHLHVVARREGDACWPRPVWGQLPEGGRYAEEQIAQWCEILGATAGLVFAAV